MRREEEIQEKLDEIYESNQTNRNSGIIDALEWVSNQTNEIFADEDDEDNEISAENFQLLEDLMIMIEDSDIEEEEKRGMLEIIQSIRTGGGIGPGGGPMK